MFTGIINHLGKLKNKKESVFTFSADKSFCKKLNKGDSIAVNGACLTVLVKPAKNSFAIEVIPETLNKTMLGYLKINNPVNLELPVTANTLLSGHIVSGHIDGVVKLLKIKPENNSQILKFSLPPALTKYIVEKGSITINGISLTVTTVTSKSFTVGIIPFTRKNTMLSSIKIGDLVNVEVDILAKYIENFLKK